MKIGTTFSDYPTQRFPQTKMVDLIISMLCEDSEECEILTELVEERDDMSAFDAPS